MIDNIMKEKQLAKLAGGDLHEVLSTNYRYLTLPYQSYLTAPFAVQVFVPYM